LTAIKIPGRGTNVKIEFYLLIITCIRQILTLFGTIFVLSTVKKTGGKNEKDSIHNASDLADSGFLYVADVPWFLG